MRPQLPARDDLATERRLLNGGGAAVLFLHATGFCSGVWSPVVEEIAASGVCCDAILFDQRGHGRSAPLTHPLDWWQLGSDVLEAADAGGDMIGVGHSSGGAALIMAELLAPGTFRRLVLIEPIVPEPPFARREEHPLAVGALRRRSRFADRDEAAASYRDRGPFAGWDDRALLGYLACALEPAPDGGVRLACSPEDEAEFYRSAYIHGAWERLGELDVPVDLVIGRDSDTHPQEYVARLAERIPRIHVTWIADANHFAPMQRPGAIASLVATALG